MSEKDIQTHQTLLFETGKYKLSKEQTSVMEKIGGDFELQLDDDVESTLELPQIRQS